MDKHKLYTLIQETKTAILHIESDMDKVRAADSCNDIIMAIAEQSPSPPISLQSCKDEVAKEYFEKHCRIFWGENFIDEDDFIAYASRQAGENIQPEWDALEMKNIKLSDKQQELQSENERLKRVFEELLASPYMSGYALSTRNNWRTKAGLT